MNLVFGSEVALLGFWEYMFGILVTVQDPGDTHTLILCGSRERLWNM
jgi:hypothetical protein